MKKKEEEEVAPSTESESESSDGDKGEEERAGSSKQVTHTPARRDLEEWIRSKLRKSDGADGDGKGTSRSGRRSGRVRR